MTLRSLMGIALGLVVIVSLVSIWFYPSIQDFMLANPFWNGLRDFSKEFDVRWIDSLSGVSQEPEGTALVVIPYVEYDQEELGEMVTFVEGGGLLVLLDDYGYGNSILEAMGLQARFAGEPLLDPLYNYRNQWLPRVTDFDGGLAGAGVGLVVLNHGTALLGVSARQVRAWSSGSSYLDRNGNESPDPGEEHGPFAVAAVLPVGRGSLLLLSDPSILINSMVERDDNGAFLERLLLEYGPERDRLVDVSHLPRAPLDQSKLRLQQARERMAHPYSVAFLLGAIVVIVLPQWRRRRPS